MATTEIASHIQGITGVGTADTDFIESAQRFVVKSVPKELLWFAGTVSSAITDGNGYDVQGADTVLSVEREGYPAERVSFSMSKWLTDSTSIHYATEKFPKYYYAQGKIFIKPDPSSGGDDDGLVYYVDYSQIDDDCDLRNAVVFHACSSEFTKLAVAALPTVSISASVPTPIGSPSISYSNASLTDDIAVAQDAISQAQDSVIQASNASASTPSSSGSSAGSSTPGSSNVILEPSYTSPTVEGASVGKGLLSMGDGTVNQDTDQIDYEKWWDILAEFIENEEDSELATIQIQKINTYIAAFKAEVEDANSGLQVSIAKAKNSLESSMSNASNTTQSSIQNAQLTTQANIATDQTATQASIAGAQNSTQVSLANVKNDIDVAVQKMQLSTQAAMQKMVQSTGAAIQKMQTSTNVAIVNAAKTLEASIQDYVLDVQRYGAEIQSYGNQVQSEVAVFQNKIAKSQIYDAQSQKYYQWALGEVQGYVQYNSKFIASQSQNNKESR